MIVSSNNLTIWVDHQDLFKTHIYILASYLSLMRGTSSSLWEGTSDLVKEIHFIVLLMMPPMIWWHPHLTAHWLLFPTNEFGGRMGKHPLRPKVWEETLTYVACFLLLLFNLLCFLFKTFYFTANNYLSLIWKTQQISNRSNVVENVVRRDLHHEKCTPHDTACNES